MNMNLKKFSVSQPLGHASNMTAIMSEGRLSPRAGMADSLSAFWKSESLVPAISLFLRAK
jgi:hypothetical protein